MKRHRCRDHIVERRGPQQGSRRWACGVCNKPVALRMKANEVLARVTN